MARDDEEKDGGQAKRCAVLGCRRSMERGDPGENVGSVGLLSLVKFRCASIVGHFSISKQRNCEFLC